MPFMIGAAVGAVMNRRDTKQVAGAVRKDLRKTPGPLGRPAGLPPLERPAELPPELPRNGSLTVRARRGRVVPGHGAVSRLPPDRGRPAQRARAPCSASARASRVARGEIGVRRRVGRVGDLHPHRRGHVAAQQHERPRIGLVQPPGPRLLRRPAPRARPSAASGILASPATSEPPTTRMRTEPYELTTPIATAPPPTRPTSIGSVPSGSRISAPQTPNSGDEPPGTGGGETFFVAQGGGLHGASLAWGPTGAAARVRSADVSHTPLRPPVDVLIRRVDPEVPLPAYGHPGDAGADLVTTEAAELAPGERAVLPTGVSIALPDGYAAFVHPRSGLAARCGVALVNAPGTVDAGYRGEIKVIVVNLDPRETRAVRAVRPDRPTGRPAGREGPLPRGGGASRLGAGRGGLRVHRRSCRRGRCHRVGIDTHRSYPTGKDSDVFGRRKKSGSARGRDGRAAEDERSSTALTPTNGTRRVGTR